MRNDTSNMVPESELYREHVSRYIKVFPLESYMVLVDPKYCVDWISIASDIKEIPVVFHRDGHYYNRKAKTSWWEYNGRAYTSKSIYEQTKWEFDNRIDRPLERLEMKELQRLQRHRDLGPVVKSLIQRSQHWWAIHDIMLSTSGLRSMRKRRAARKSDGKYRSRQG